MRFRHLTAAALITTAVAASALPVAGAATAKDTRSGCQADRRTSVPGGTTATSGGWEPCVIDTGTKSGQSVLSVTPAGALVRSVTTEPAGIALSTDQGKTWQTRALPSDASGVSDSAYDAVTGRLFAASALGGNYWSDDLGKTWHASTIDSSQHQDWPKLFVGRPTAPRTTGYPNNVYYCNWPIPLGVVTPVRCWRSTDGGQTFVTAGPDLPIAACDQVDAVPSMNHGRGIVDPRDGTLYLPVGQCGHIYVYVSHDEGASWSRRLVTGAHQTGVSAVATQAMDVPWLLQQTSGSPNPVGPNLAASEQTDVLGQDASGRLYAAWIDVPDYLPYLATSADGGQTWTKPVKASPPGVVQAALTSITVTATGRVGLSYYGSTDKTAFTGYLAVTDDATSPTPTFQTATVTRPGQPLMPQPCCWANGTQEYTAARWAPDGTLYAAFIKALDGGKAEGMVGRLVRPAAPTVRHATKPQHSGHDVADAPHAPSGHLAATGVPSALPVLAVLLVGGATAFARRKRRAHGL